METTVNSSGVSYDHTKFQDKHFFGGFFNLAQDNIDSVIKAFCNKFAPNDTEINSAQFFERYFKDNMADSDFQKKVRFLKIHFPIAGYLKYENEKAEFSRKFSMLLKAIAALRNFYTHYYHEPLNLSHELFELIDDVFVKVTKDLRKLKKNDHKTSHVLSKNLSEEFETLKQRQIERLNELRSKGKNVSFDEESVRNGVFNSAFSHLIYKEGLDFKASSAYRSFHSGEAPTENSISFSQSGLLFLLSMFLGRKETEDLKSRVRGFKAKIIRQGEEQISGLKFMATHWVFSYLCFKGAKQKLSTEFHEETLLVQIIDELSKVPDEVYTSFDADTKEKFIEDINEYVKEGKEDPSREEAMVSHPVIRKRYENKFNYFAIRFLDEYLGSTSLKFQVHVGNYVHDRRVKDINGTGYQTERVVKDRIKVFGKLSDISSLKTDYIKKRLVLPDDGSGWEIFPNPSYVFIDNNIPIHILADKATKDGIKTFKTLRKSQQPEEMKDRSGGKLNKFGIANKLSEGTDSKNKFRIEEPAALLSLNEIPALLYLILEKGATAEEIEQIIKDKLKENFEKIKNYDPQTPLPASQISKRIRNNVTDKGREMIYGEKLISLIGREIEKTEHKLKLIDDKHTEREKERRRGKPVKKALFSNAELGQEAQWLADDIKRFMPTELRKNWKGYQHSQLQQSLAFFDKKPKEAQNLLQAEWDTSDASSHWNGWITSSFAEARFFDWFLEIYLKGRKKYFSQLAANIAQHIGNQALLRKFIAQQMPKDLFPKRHYLLKDLETEKNKILSKPLVFPRGLFDDKPTFIKGVKITDEPERFADWYRYGYSQDHTFQKFYDWKRDYRDLLEEKKKQDSTFAENCAHYDTASQLDLIQLKQDLKIKNIKIQDLFLKRIAEELFLRIFRHPASFPLEELYQTREERAEKEENAWAQSARKEGDDSPNIIKDNFIWSKTTPYQNGQIYEPAIKLKDIGKFNRFLIGDKGDKGDKNINKVTTLLSYNKDKIWNKEELENELTIGENSYETIRREKLFKELQAIELHTLSAWPWDGIHHPGEFENQNKKGERFPHFKMYMVNGILRKNKDWFAEGEDLWLAGLNDKDFKNLSSDELSTKSEAVQLLFLVIMIRNQFAHNHLPAVQFYDFILNRYPEIQGQTVSERYMNFIKYAAQKLLK